MDNKSIKKEREELEQFFQVIYEKDLSDLEKTISTLTDKEKEIFIKGYNYANKYPSGKIIRLIVMYTLDYIPYYKHVPSIKVISHKIWDIFKKNINASINS